MLQVKYLTQQINELVGFIALAGGFTPRALQSNADVTRKINGEILTGRVLISNPVLAGDTIYILERLF